MSLRSDFVHELFPFFRDALRDSANAFRTAKRRRRHLFVLQAMGTPPAARLSTNITGVRFDIASIDRLVRMEQLQRAHGGKERLDDMTLMAWMMNRAEDSPENRKASERQLHLQRKLGRPDIHAADREQRLEGILHDMVEANKLKFHPPNMWSVL
jgi:hypothetical protein